MIAIYLLYIVVIFWLLFILVTTRTTLNKFICVILILVWPLTFLVIIAFYDENMLEQEEVKEDEKIKYKKDNKFNDYDL